MKEFLCVIVILVVFLVLGIAVFECMLIQAIGRNRNWKVEDEEQIRYLRQNRKKKQEGIKKYEFKKDN